jgi:hypothetical protein
MDAGDALGPINATAARARRATKFSLDGSGVKPYWSAYQSRGATRSKWDHSNSKSGKFKKRQIQRVENSGKDMFKCFSYEITPATQSDVCS